MVLAGSVGWNQSRNIFGGDTDKPGVLFLPVSMYVCVYNTTLGRSILVRHLFTAKITKKKTKKKT